MKRYYRKRLPNIFQLYPLIIKSKETNWKARQLNIAHISRHNTNTNSITVTVTSIKETDQPDQATSLTSISRNNNNSNRTSNNSNPN